MSYCTKCGRTYEDGKFKCSFCGAPLAYAPSAKGPSLFDKMMNYRSFFILIAIAVIISMISFAAQILSAMFWLIFVGVAAGLLFLFIKQRRRTHYNPPSYKNRNPRGSDPRNYGYTGNKPSNVIPFKKRRNDREGKSKNNQKA